jgi:hypothetical protein
MVAERYKFVEDVLNDNLRFYDFEKTKRLDKESLCAQMYWAVRRDYSKELLQIVEGGGDAYSRLHAIVKFIKENT